MYISWDCLFKRNIFVFTILMGERGQGGTDGFDSCVENDLQRHPSDNVQIVFIFLIADKELIIIIIS